MKMPALLDNEGDAAGDDELVNSKCLAFMMTASSFLSWLNACTPATQARRPAGAR
jgi:hypothetical protein